jgi:hypothetical protein
VIRVCVCRASTKQWFTSGKKGKASGFDVKRSQGWYSIAAAAAGQVSVVFGSDGIAMPQARSTLGAQSGAIMAARSCVHKMSHVGAVRLAACVRGLRSKEQMCA